MTEAEKMQTLRVILGHLARQAGGEIVFPRSDIDTGQPFRLEINLNKEQVIVRSKFTDVPNRKALREIFGALND